MAVIKDKTITIESLPVLHPGSSVYIGVVTRMGLVAAYIKEAL